MSDSFFYFNNMQPRKVLMFFIMLSFTITSYGYGQSKKEDLRPNIVVFLVDDMGWQDTSEPFWTEKTALNRKYHTPNMERLAKDGVKFTQAYAAPVCSPSRISLMTGMNAAKHRVTNWTLRNNQTTDAKDNELDFPKWNVNGMSPVKGIENTIYALPLPQILKNNGYRTIMVGKAHFGAIGTPAADPTNLGFEINIGGHAAGSPGSYLGTENFGKKLAKDSIWAVPGLEEFYGKDIFLTEALTQKTLGVLDTITKKKDPFFLYMAHYAVHVPMYADKRFYQKYKEAGLDDTEAKYASMVEGMDKSLGDIMGYLEAHQLTKNTIIIFMSDNGGLSANGRGGALHVHNKPLNSGKGSMYEGGIRVPMMVKWPSRIKAGSVNNQYLIIEDLFPTILKMANVVMPKTPQHIDGKNFLPLLNEKDNEQTRPLFWHFPNRWGSTGPGIGSISTVRKGDFKLLYYHKTKAFELFDIKKDIEESHNLASEYPQKVKELAKVLSNYLRTSNAQMPTYKSTGLKVPYPDEVVF